MSNIIKSLNNIQKNVRNGNNDFQEPIEDIENNSNSNLNNINSNQAINQQNNILTNSGQNNIKLSVKRNQQITIQLNAIEEDDDAINELEERNQSLLGHKRRLEGICTNLNNRVQSTLEEAACEREAKLHTQMRLTEKINELHTLDNKYNNLIRGYNIVKSEKDQYFIQLTQLRREIGNLRDQLNRKDQEIAHVNDFNNNRINRKNQELRERDELILQLREELERLRRPQVEEPVVPLFMCSVCLIEVPQERVQFGPHCNFCICNGCGNAVANRLFAGRRAYNTHCTICKQRFDGRGERR